MAHKNQYPTSKIIATALGATLVGLEAWLNAEYITSQDGWRISTVALVAIATVGGAGALPIAERAFKAGQKVWAFCLALTFLFMATFSLFTTFIRLDDKRSGEVVSARTGDGRVKLAQEAYDAAKKTAEEECVKRGPKCREAEEKRDKKRGELASLPAERGAESMTKQAGALVQLYAFPLGQMLGGFALLAFGLSPKGREPKPETAESKKARKPRKRKLTAISQVEDGNVIRLKTRAR